MNKKYLWMALMITAVAAGSNLYAWVPLGGVWADSLSGYYINPTNLSSLSDDAVLESINIAADNWGYAGASFNFCFQGVTSRRNVQRDGRNDVFFRNQDAGGAIAATYVWGAGGVIVEFDMVHFEGRFRFAGLGDSCSGRFYLVYIDTHELGHALGLGHSQYSYAIMYASARYCDTRTQLEDDDIDGVTGLYGLGDPPGCL